MTARQPQRPRRRSARASTSASTMATPPRSRLPAQAAPAVVQAPPALPGRTARPHLSRSREHHVTKDYRYVRSDLVGIGAIGAAVLAFIVVMSFVVG